MAANIQKAEEKRDEEQGKLDEHDIRVQEAKDSDAECVKREEAASHAVQAAKTEVNQCRASLKELRVPRPFYSGFALTHLGISNKS